MNLNLQPEMTFSQMEEVLRKELPQYKIKLRKNPIARFEYLEVRKSAYVGVWIRIYEKKNRVSLMRCIPSDIARGLFGGLIVILMFMKAQGKVQKETAEVLKSKFNTSEC